MHSYELDEKPFKLLDDSFTTYKGLKLPCSTASSIPLNQLEEQVEKAFLLGYEAVAKLDNILLFQWIAKMVYGIVFNEIQAGIRQQHRSGEALNFSQVLAHKFTHLHYALQSIVKPVIFEGAKPFTIAVFEVDNPEPTFSYRDEINTLVFSLRMKNFGIIACLQDNGANGLYHDHILSAIQGQKLHPIQFEELCAKFFYSAYRFNRLPEYTILPTDEAIYIEPMSLSGTDSRPIFDAYQSKTYGQVLENFWKPWGFQLFEIIKDPEHPLSFLLDSDQNTIPASSISLERY